MVKLGNGKMFKIRLITAVAGLLSLVVFVPSFSQVVGNPVQVVVAKTGGATMSIPRWKAYMMPNNPDRIWLGFATWGATSGQLANTVNGGDTWNIPEIFLTNSFDCDFHLSVAGDNAGNIYAVSPVGGDILLRKINYPAQSISDADVVRTAYSAGGLPRANVMIEPSNQRLWVFTRVSGSPSENVRYHYSDNDGQSWTRGVADNSMANEVRIGSMPYIDGRPALVVAYMNSPNGFRYFLWNGSSFEARPDYQIFSGNLGTDRAFTHNVIAGEYFHLIFGFGNDLHHYWKPYNNGTGSWNSELIDNSSFTSGIDWEVTSTVRGDNLFLFYRKQISSSASSAEIFFKKWSQSSQTWTSPAVVSTHPQDTNNRWPNTVMQSSGSTDFIPVFYYSDLGSNSKQIYFNELFQLSSNVNDESQDKLPELFELKQNYPNPFNPRTFIDYSVPYKSPVKIKVYDLLGRVVRELVNENMPVGSHTTTWDGFGNNREPMASGIYFYRLKAGDYSESKKMLLLK
jgi:hypothetical protein